MGLNTLLVHHYYYIVLITISIITLILLYLVSSSSRVGRLHLLNNVWNWHQILGKAGHVASLESVVPWKWTCNGDQPKGLEPYLSSLSSIWARAIMSARSAKLLALRSRLQNQTFEFVNSSQYHYNDCNVHLVDASTGCVHCTVDCPVLWPKVDHFLEEVLGLGEVLAI